MCAVGLATFVTACRRDEPAPDPARAASATLPACARPAASLGWAAPLPTGFPLPASAVVHSVEPWREGHVALVRAGGSIRDVAAALARDLPARGFRVVRSEVDANDAEISWEGHGCRGDVELAAVDRCVDAVELRITSVRMP